VRAKETCASDSIFEGPITAGRKRINLAIARIAFFASFTLARRRTASAKIKVDRSAWKIKPTGYSDTEFIEETWDDILRLIATIKLKETTASEIFRRLNSYSQQHALYRALKAFGKIVKSLFILRYIDEVELRQAIERQLNKIEHAHRFTRAVSVVSWQHINLLGEYDFSDEKLRDSVGIKPPKLTA
jgi:hypothetical protein